MGTLIFVVTVWATLSLWIGWNIMNDFTRLNAALAALGAAVESVAVAIRNPQVDNNDQAKIDEFAGRLESVAAGLSGLAAEETAMDTANEIEADPPASDPIEGSGEAVDPGESEATSDTAAEGSEDSAGSAAGSAEEEGGQ